MPFFYSQCCLFDCFAVSSLSDRPGLLCLVIYRIIKLSEAYYIIFVYNSPVFLRTDQMAGKHSWDRTCYVESADVMYRHVMMLLEDNYMADMAGEVLPSGLAVREYLDLDWSFRTFGGNMPIATEVRTFLRDGIVECIHPYWPPDAIGEWTMRASQHMEVPTDWRDALKRQDAKIERDMDMIHAQALRIAAVMDGWWSCDMVLGKDGIWYLIDMAPGAASYHWPTCKYAPTD